MRRKPLAAGAFRRMRRRGFALVMVLGIVAIVLVVAVGFLLRSATERSLAGGYANLSSARRMADMAVGLVQGQINHATTRGSTVAWASQPGMIRTFNSNGTLQQAYKLYSCANLVVDDVGIVSGHSPDEAPDTWSSSPALWTDLNAPVSVGDVAHYPIVDPKATAKGFAIDSAPGASASQPAPMPVQWLYILQDGSMVAPSALNATAVSVTGADAKTNPVVGRVAFWTDDDTCRVNINTAAAGTYWATPHVATTEDRDLANYQPANREFQRYPGHPATTSRQAVFPSLSEDEIYELVPRIVGGGSDLGSTVASGALTTDADRLYADVDELAFRDALDSATTRASNSDLTAEDIERARFFLTARSRAPETNLFNMPRIALWPIYQLTVTNTFDNARTTAFDQLIGLCSSTGEVGSTAFAPYFFQRQNADSPTADIGIPRNQNLLAYLRELTGQAIPGFGSVTFESKYGEDDRNQILTEIFDYVRSANLYDDYLAIGNQFTDGRSTSATYVQGVDAGHGWVVPSYDETTKTMGMGRAYTVSEVAIGFICNATSDDTKTPDDESYGSNDPATNRVLGGTPLAEGERMIQAIVIPELFSPMLGWTAIRPAMTVRITGLEGLTISDGTTSQALFPTLGPGQDYTEFSIQVTGMYGGRYWGGNPSWRYFGYNGGTNKGSPARPPLLADNSSLSPYPFIGLPVRINASSGAMTFNSTNAAITIEIYAGTGAPMAENLIQTLTVRFPDVVLPVPNLVTTGTPVDGASGKETALATQQENWWAYSQRGTALDATHTEIPGRLAFINQNQAVASLGKVAPLAGAFFRYDFDVVQSVLPAHGDYRLVAASHEVPDTVFVQHPRYGLDRIATNLTTSGTSWSEFGFSGGGTYVDGLNYGNWEPDIPSTATGSDNPSGTGDYDTGLPYAPDGPYVNKPDEGNTYRDNASDIPYFTTIARQNTATKTFFSPNRQMPSPGMLGSLPTGVKSNTPWRTLLFRHQPGHFGATAPADHLLLDLFWMPVVEPYAISDRFSTAGKINMNYQILPFTYITRSTGLWAVLQDEKVAAIPNSLSNTYRNTVTGTKTRLDVDVDATLEQFEDIFENGGMFKSASQICDLDIVPQGQSAAGMTGFWTSHALTGDNLRELVYTTIYPRLTTKSNTYTVYFRAQSLKMSPNATAGRWDEQQGTVTGEYRGQTTIERFIDANNTDIPDYAPSPQGKDTLDTFYKWRVVQNRQFAP